MIQIYFPVFYARARVWKFVARRHAGRAANSVFPCGRLPAGKYAAPEN